MRKENTPAILLCVLFLGGCADRWLIYPSTQPMDAHLAGKRVFVREGRKIEVYVARSAVEPVAFSLDFCGNSGRAEQIATKRDLQWGAHPVEVWVPNYPGFGRTDGPASLRYFPGDALAVYDELKKRAGNRPIFVNGFSLGTTVALYVAAHRPIAGMILQSPPPLQREIMWHYGWWNLWMVASVTALEIPCEMNSLINAPKIHAPAVFVLSDADTIIPLDYQMMVVKAYKGDKHLVLRSQADHNTPISSADEIRFQREQDWLWRRRLADE